MKILIVGTGYVGLVTGACLSDVGIEVICVDIDSNKIDRLKDGNIPIYEAGLEDLVKRNIEKGRLHFSTSLKENIKGVDVVFIAVGTPQGEDGSADLTYVLNVAKEIGESLQDYAVIVTKSTVPVGSSQKVKEAIQKTVNARKEKVDFDVASNPEFLKEGVAVQDFLRPDRIVIGTESKRARAILERLYRPFQLNGHRIIFMDIASAEMTKYAANAMLATRISFMNDIANLCEIVGADISQVREGIGSDPRIGAKFLYAGTGYGGSCFPKDVQALIKTGNELKHPLRLLEAVEAINSDQRTILVRKLKAFYKGNLKGKKVSLWGLTFKPQTDDMRMAPSLYVIEQLVKEGAEVFAYDPIGTKQAMKEISQTVNYCEDAYSALNDSDALLLLTEWPEFRIPDWQEVKKRMNNPAVFDGRNIYNSSELTAHGIHYEGIGVKVDE